MRCRSCFSSWGWPRRRSLAALCLAGMFLWGPGGVTPAPARAAPDPTRWLPAVTADPRDASPQTPATAPDETGGTGNPGQAAKELAVDLPVVLRLTEQNNLRIAVARQRLEESLLSYQIACQSCVPDFLRPQDKRRITTEANVWRQRADLSQVTHDALQEAAYTYLDWLSVRQQEAVARQLEGYLRRLLTRTQKLRETEPGVGHLVETIRAAISARQQDAVSLHEQGTAAGDKLAYLLGVSHVFLEPGSTAPVPLDVVDVTPPVQALAARAASAGPTVRELEGLWAVVQKGIDAACLLQLAAQCEGPHSKPGLQLQAAVSKRDEVGLNLEDTRRRLALAAREAYQLIGSTRVQASVDAEEIRHAEEAQRLSNLRLRELGPDRAEALTMEVVQSIQALGAANGHLIATLNSHNKAQVRLLLVLGPDTKHVDPPNAGCGP
jgi:hypothetical protein